jgi:hypothetical protein
MLLLYAVPMEVVGTLRRAVHSAVPMAYGTQLREARSRLCPCFTGACACYFILINANGMPSQNAVAKFAVALPPENRYN